jgi:hypothetical protein
MPRAISIEHIPSDSHKENACCEMPPAVLYQAIQMAISEPWAEDGPYSSNWEKHPAMRHICDWWNAHAPTLEFRRAAQAVLWVRENGRYYSAGEEPSESIRRRDKQDRCAFCGDHILVEFQQGMAAYVYEPFGLHQMLCTTIVGVDGVPRLHVGASPNECNDDALSLQYLEQFPNRCTRAWEQLRRLALQG